MIRRKRSFLYLSMLTMMAAVVIVLLVYRAEQEQKFPRLAQGQYVGYLKGVFAQDEESSVPFYLEVDQGVLVAVLRTGWNPIYFENFYSRKDVPLELSGSEATLRLAGTEQGSNGYRGTVYNLAQNFKGSWEIHLIGNRAESDLIEARVDQIKNVVLLRQEKKSLEEEIDTLDHTLEKATAGVKKLDDFVSDAETLKHRTRQKLEKVQAVYEKESKIFAGHRRDARALAKQLALSERVTEVGNLVSLSRKTLDRENRWLDSIFDTSTALSSYDFDQEVDRAKKIMELKEKISNLKNSSGITPQ